MPDLANLVLDGIQRWGYLLVAGLALLETAAFVGLLVPGETAVVLGGVLAGTGRLDLVTLLWIVPIGAALGDQIGYALGRRYGTAVLLRVGGRVRISAGAVARVETFFARRGAATVLLGRFVGFARALTPFLAGSGRMRWRVFTAWSLVGCALWSTAFTLLGYLAGANWQRVVGYAGRGVLTLAVVGVIVGAAVATGRWLARNESWVRERRRWAARYAVAHPRTATGVRLGLRPLGFVGRRLSPRQAFGLDLTAGLVVVTLLAAGLVRLVESAPITGGRVGGLDREVELRAVDLRTGSGIDVARALTDLGSLPVLFALAGFAAAGLLVAGRRLRAAEIVVAAVGAWVLMIVIKAIVARPRPEVDLSAIGALGSPSFPSGHALVGTAVLGALAFAAGEVVERWSVRMAIWVAAVVLAAGIAASRVYLGVHYLSDVVGGMAIGALWLTITLTVAEPLRRHRVLAAGASPPPPSPPMRSGRGSGRPAPRPRAVSGHRERSARR